MLREPVSAVQVREAVTVGPDASVREAIRVMKHAHLGGLFIVDKDQKPTGIFTERHVLRNLAVEGWLSDPVWKYATTPSALAQTSDTIARVVQIMRVSDVRFVGVVDEQGKLVGVTGPRGVIEYVTEFFPRVVKVQMMDTKLHFDQREGA